MKINNGPADDPQRRPAQISRHERAAPREGQRLFLYLRAARSPRGSSFDDSAASTFARDEARARRQIHHAAIRNVEKASHSHDVYEFFRSYFRGNDETVRTRISLLERAHTTLGGDDWDKALEEAAAGDDADAALALAELVSLGGDPVAAAGLLRGDARKRVEALGAAPTTENADAAADAFAPASESKSHRRRGCGYSMETTRGDAAAGTWIVRGDASRHAAPNADPSSTPRRTRPPRHVLTAASLPETDRPQARSLRGRRGFGRRRRVNPMLAPLPRAAGANEI